MKLKETLFSFYEYKYKDLTVRADRSNSDGMGRMMIANERLAFTIKFKDATNIFDI